jgi:hypothetical protein
MEEHRHRPPAEKLHEGTKVVDDAQATRNEAQQSPANSGDPRTSNAIGVPLPWGAPTDDLHPITQPQGDVSDPRSSDPGAPTEQRRKERKSA